MSDRAISLITEPIRIALLLVDGFALMSYASLIEPFRAANSLAGQPLYEWVHVSTGGPEARASNGAMIKADHQVGDALACQRLFVFAAGDPAGFRDRATFAWLREQARKEVSMGGVSGGPYLLARAGLLAGHRATIHWEHAAALQEEFPELELMPSLFVTDRGRMTCAGGTAGLDLALSLIEADHGPALGAQVGEWFIRTQPRQAELSQRPALSDRYGTTNERLLRMLAATEDNIEDPLPREELARIAGISLRQLERLSRRHLGKSVAEACLAIRLDRAAQLLRSTGLSVTAVALACGFKSPSHFSRRFAARFGRPPSHAAS